MSSPRRDISPKLARLLELPEHAEEALVARRMAQLIGTRPPSNAKSIRLLAEIVWHVDEAFVGRPDDPVDTAEVAHGVISSIGLDLSQEEWSEIGRELGEDDIADKIMSFAAHTLAPQLSYAGLIDLHPPPPQPGYAQPWPAARRQ